MTITDSVKPKRSEHRGGGGGVEREAEIYNRAGGT